MRDECRDCVHQSSISGCVHPYGWRYDYEDIPEHCPYFQEEHR